MMEVSRPSRRDSRYGLTVLTILAISVAFCLPWSAVAQEAVFPQSGPEYNDTGIMEPFSSAVQGKVIRVPNTDQSADGLIQTSVQGSMMFEDAFGGGVLSMLGHEITQVESPNEDMRLALQQMFITSRANNTAGMQTAAQELIDILLGTTEGRIYDGFSMLNFNRWKDARISAAHFPPDAVPGEYKMKVAVDTGQTYTSPFDGEQRKIWEVDINMLYYDGQIDSDTFLVKFPFGHHKDDVLHVNYRIFSLVQEDFSPTLVMLDRREAPNTVSFPFKGFDAVWIPFFPGQVLNVTVKYPPVRMIRGVYTWGWRVHPPRIQFMQPIYEIRNAHTDEIELDPQGESFAFRNREDLTLDTIGEAAPEMKMYQVATAALNGATPLQIQRQLIFPNEGPRGTWFEWADLATEQRQLPPEAKDLLEAEGKVVEDFEMVSVFLNNEMYGAGPGQNEVPQWQQGQTFTVKLYNMDNHTHYFRNVDFSDRLHDDIRICCGGGDTSFEIMNFKPSYGAPKVAEMQWRAGWGFKPHHDVIQGQGLFSRGVDRVGITPFTSGDNKTYFGYQYSEGFRNGDFRFNPPPFIVSDLHGGSLRDADGEVGLVIGQTTEGYGTAQMCPDDPFPGFCATDIAAYNPHGSLNWPPPPLRGVNGNPEVATELRFPPFLRNPGQTDPAKIAQAGDIIPPTAAWRPFLWINPNNGSLFIDPDDPSKGHWADLTMSHGAPVFAQDGITATIELPRAAGQVFYQFDDLFHDNSIFSPHPKDNRNQTLTDEIAHLRAFPHPGGYVAVRARIKTVVGDSQRLASWVVLTDGPAGAKGCTGNVVGIAPVQPDTNGVITLRCGANAVDNVCKGSHLFNKAVTSGQNLCLQTNVGAFAVTSVE